MTAMRGVRAAVVYVADALTAAGMTVHTDPTTAPVGPCAVVGVPTITEQDGGGHCAVWSLDVPVLLVPTSAVARAELLDLIDLALDAVALAGLQVTGSPGLLEQGTDGQLDAYQLTVTID